MLMDWSALGLISIPLTGITLYCLLRQMCHRQRLGYTQILTPACIQICEQRDIESVENGREGLQENRRTQENGSRYPQQQQQQRVMRRARPKQTFVKLLRPLPVQPVCTSNGIKSGDGKQQTIHISKDLMPQGQNIPHSAAIQSGCEEQGEEKDDKIFSTSDQDLCPVCQLPLPKSRQQRNRTSTYHHPVSGSSWSEAEHLQTSGAGLLPPNCPHLTSPAPAHHLLPSYCSHQTLPSSPTTGYPASSEQVICPDCWPLVRSLLM